MHTDSEDKALAGFASKTPRQKAEKTGRYRNPSTMHEARFKAGAVLPPGYEPVSDEPPEEPDPVTNTVTVEPPEALDELKKLAEAVGKRAEDAERELAEQRDENKHLRERIEKLEDGAKDTSAFDALLARLDALEAQTTVAGHAGTPAETPASGDTPAEKSKTTPRRSAK